CPLGFRTANRIECPLLRFCTLASCVESTSSTERRCALNYRQPHQGVTPNRREPLKNKIVRAFFFGIE
ncbi:hypothetical protein, partial [Pseudoduganella namucuonensis]|uniref:hypothetical protein n=1 Tax=Pseudoduganella namucuonensis TaxID=1035707 RepID=UPI001C432962